MPSSLDSASDSVSELALSFRLLMIAQDLLTIRSGGPWNRKTFGDNTSTPEYCGARLAN